MANIVRSSNNTRFTLLKKQMVENDPINPYSLFRKDLKTALLESETTVQYDLRIGVKPLFGYLVQGTTQRGKKFISIGCMRFVGENRRKLLQWAKSGK